MSLDEFSTRSSDIVAREAAQPSPSRTHVQLKKQLAGMSYAQQIQMLRPAGLAAPLVQLKAVQFVDPPQPQPQGTIPGTQGAANGGAPALERTADPNSFAESKRVYETNFGTVKGNITTRGGTPAQVSSFEAKKGDWFTRWGTAALQTNADAAKGEFQKIEADLQSMFPDDAPTEGGGNLYTGYAGGGSGRGRAEEAAAAGNAAAPAGVTYRTLEKTLVGNMFDSVAQTKKDPVEQAKWIPYWASKAAEWWGQISSTFAGTFTGAVHASVDLGMPYYVSKVGEGKPATERRAMTGELQATIKLDAGSVFAKDELPRVATGMSEGRVTELVVNLKIEVTTGNLRNSVLTIPAAGVASGADLLGRITAHVQSLVTVADLLPNIV